MDFKKILRDKRVHDFTTAALAGVATGIATYGITNKLKRKKSKATGYSDTIFTLNNLNFKGSEFDDSVFTVMEFKDVLHKAVTDKFSYAYLKKSYRNVGSIKLEIEWLPVNEPPHPIADADCKTTKVFKHNDTEYNWYTVKEERRDGSTCFISLLQFITNEDELVRVAITYDDVAKESVTEMLSHYALALHEYIYE